MAWAHGSSVKISNGVGDFSGASTVRFEHYIKTGERIVRGRQESVNRSVCASLCIAAENVAKLFLRRIVVELLLC
jgi:hypothetical protein